MQLNDSDLRFVVETVATRRRDFDHVMDLVRGKEDLLEPMLEDPRLLERLLSEREAFVRISPALLFDLLLRRIRRDLEKEAFVYEIGERGQRIPIFEAPQIVDLLSTSMLRDYLVEMLGSFVRVNSGILSWQEEGKWRRRRFSDMDLDDMVLLCRLAGPEYRALLYKRIADIALFLSGIYPDHATLFGARPRAALTHRRSIQDYETEGQRFYSLAARELEEPPLRSACETLAEKFTLARHALNTLSDRYLKAFKARHLAFPAG